MNNFKMLKRVYIISGVIFFFLGLYALMFPHVLMRFLSIAVGSLCISFGALQIYQGVSKQQAGYFQTVKLFFGVLLFVTGLVFVVRQNLPYMIFSGCFGLWALVSGAMKLNTAIQLKQLQQKYLVVLIFSIIHLIFGALIILFPLTSTSVFVRVIGAYWVYLGVCLILSYFSKQENYFF